MKIKDNTQIMSSVMSLTAIGVKNKIITEVEAGLYRKLSKGEPLVIFGILCEQFYKLGATKLFRERGDVMQTLKVCYPTFTAFIGRQTLSANKNKFGKRAQTLIPSQVMGLVKTAFESGLITIEEREMYEDIIKWDASNADDIEIDVLLKISTWNYKEIKEKAPEILDYIRKIYPDYFEKIMEPYLKEIKKKVL